MNKLSYLILALTVLLSACGGTGSTPTVSNSAEAVSEAAPPATALGSTGKAEGVDFTVTAVATPNQIGPAGVGPKAEAGETFVVVSYTIKNTSAKPLPLMERPGLNLVGANGQSYAPDVMASPMAAAMMDDMTGNLRGLPGPFLRTPQRPTARPWTPTPCDGGRAQRS